MAFALLSGLVGAFLARGAAAPGGVYLAERPEGRRVMRAPRTNMIGPGVFNPLRNLGGSIATRNRWTGRPHAHAREIARNTKRKG